MVPAKARAIRMAPMYMKGTKYRISVTGREIFAMAAMYGRMTKPVMK